MKTYSAKKEEQQRKWYLIDAKDQILGKVAERAANILRGKNKVTFTPHVDTGDYVIIINADKVAVSGKKFTNKVYMSYSGYIGGEKRESFRHRLERCPELIIEHAVKGMIPHNRLGRRIFTKLKVYAGETHPHQAQSPEPVNIS
jgi:large subunit ribosomal protein L13